MLFEGPAQRSFGSLRGLIPELLWIGAAAIVVSFSGGCAPDDNLGPQCEDDPDRFDDHSRACIESTEDFFELAGERAGEATAVKTTLLSFSDPDERNVRFMDTKFYELHDEFYIYQMMNGHRFEGEDLVDPHDGDFETIADIYDWSYEQAQLPAQLAFWGERLYAARFYELWEQEPRSVGPAVIVHYDAREGPDARDEIWAFELEHGDVPSHETLSVYFELIGGHVADEIGDDLRWLVRSQAQEELAQTMEAQELAYHDRILRYSELSNPGEVTVYNPGLTAGRLRMVRAGEIISKSTVNDILIFEETPDYLPPCRALITSRPQTPLAHINILAKSRQIPNLSIADVIDDPDIDQIARINGRVAMIALEPDHFQFVQMSKEDYDAWLLLQKEPKKSVPPVAVDKLPYAVPLSSVSFDDATDLRPILGGKSTGLLALQDAESIEYPRSPAAITTRAYIEHLAPLRDQVAELLVQPEFLSTSQFKARYLALEGEADYDQRYPTPIAQSEKEEILARPEGDPLADVIREGGLRSMVRNRAMDPATLADLEFFLKLQFLDHSPGQGIRFRSSSNVEDIEGFNGAGLYTSKTGFLFPEAQPADDQHRTVERALLKVWASYWGAEAFEERMLENVEHLTGSMGVTVHARFDDPLETANGVIHITRMPPWSSIAYEVEIDSQRDDVSVTNPDSGALPEVVYLRLDNGEMTPSIERAQASTLEPAGEPVLSDAELLTLFEQTRAITDHWFAVEGTPWPAAQARQSLNLDLEYRRVAEGWPALTQGPPLPARLVLKQSRSLDPDPSHLSEEVAALPFPRDLLARARRVEQWTCTSDAVTFVVHESWTDSFSTPDLGYSEQPFTGSVRLEINEDIAQLGLSGGEVIELDHLGMAEVAHPGLEDGEAWSLDLSTNAAGQALGIDRLVLDPEGDWSLHQGGEVVEGSLPACEYELLHSTADELLLSLLAAAE